MFLQNQTIQNKLTRYVTRELSSNLGTNISIENISITFFNRYQISNLYVEDLNGDSLLFSEKTKITIKSLNLKENIFNIRSISLDNASIHLIQQPEGGINLSFIIDKLKNPDKPKKGGSSLNFHRIALDNSRFRLSDPDGEKSGRGIDFKSLDINDLDITVNKMSIEEGEVRFDIRRLEFIESSGFTLNNLRTEMLISGKDLHFNNLFISTPYSAISANVIDFDFRSFQDFSDYLFKVDNEFNLRSSSVSFIDLSYFAPSLGTFTETFRISGLIKGSISDLSAKEIILDYNDHTRLEGSFNIIGLPDIRQTFMHYDVKSFRTNTRDLRNIKFPGQGKLDIPDMMDQLGTITYKGKFTGYLDDFVAYGKFGSDLGVISSDLMLKPDTAGSFRYRGQIETRSFSLGMLFPEEKILGGITLSANVDGSLQDGNISADLEAVVDSIYLNKYTYRNIDIRGKLDQSMFDGSLDISDPNIEMEFLGAINFSADDPVFDFTADVSRLRPYQLHMIDSIPSAYASFLMEANFSGAHPDSIDGELILVNSLFRKDEEEIRINNFKVISDLKKDDRSIQVQSDLLDAEISGNFEIISLGKSLNNFMATYIPAIAGTAPDSLFDDKNEIDFTFHLKNFEQITQFFTPEYSISNDSYFAGFYNPRENLVEFTGNIEKLKIKNNQFEDLLLISTASEDKYDFTAMSGNYVMGENLSLNNLVLNTTVIQDTLYSDINWSNYSTPKYQGNLNFETILHPDHLVNQKNIEIWIRPSNIIFNDTIWEINGDRIIIDSSYISVDSFQIANQKQLLLIDGRVSGNPDDQLSVRLRDLDMSVLNNFTAENGIKLQGSISGSANLKDPFHQPVFLSDLTMYDVSMNGESFGEGKLTAKWNNRDRNIDILFSANRARTEIIHLEGIYSPLSSELDLDFSFEKINLATFSSFTRDFLTRPSGLTTGNFKISGKLNQPLVNGKIELFKSAVTVDYLQTRYSFTQEFNIRNNNIEFREFEIYDSEGNRAVANGNINSQYFKDMNFNIQMETDNFTFLNTESKDNDLFYGKVVAGGVIRLTGPANNLLIDITSSTTGSSVFHIPLYGVEEANETDFIQFVNTGPEPDEEKTSRHEVDMKGLRMNFNLEVTPDAQVQLIFDPKIGDIMKARGKGNLNLSITPLGEFEIYGGMTLQSGDYLFTLQNVINKHFKIQSGTINWNGDPADANININAVYSLKTSVYPLAPEPNEQLKKRIPVECQIKLTGKLENPTIRPDIVLPTADQETRNIVSNSINTDEELMKQFSAGNQ